MLPLLRVLLVAIFSLLGGCAMFAPPENLDVRTTRMTEQKAFEVSIRPLRAPVPLNQIHSWEIQLRNANGEPVSGARIRFGGGMPQHFHGYPTQPRVTADLGNGRYRLDGVKFSMTGWWEMKLDIHTDDRTDVITFNTIIVQARSPS